MYTESEWVRERKAHIGKKSHIEIFQLSLYLYFSNIDCHWVIHANDWCRFKYYVKRSERGKVNFSLLLRCNAWYSWQTPKSIFHFAFLMILWFRDLRQFIKGFFFKEVAQYAEYNFSRPSFFNHFLMFHTSRRFWRRKSKGLKVYTSHHYYYELWHIYPNISTAITQLHLSISQFTQTSNNKFNFVFSIKLKWW